MLQIQDLKKTYPGFSLQADLEVADGSIVGLIGANGAGKSTIFKAILGLIHTDSRELKLFGKDVSCLTLSDREAIGTVLTESGFSGYLTPGDAEKILEAMYPSFDKSYFREKAQAFGLDYKKQIKEFSTGMKARLKVLAALAHHPKFLLLDEPTAGLDIIARDEVYSMIRDYMAESEDHTVLISSHISTDLERLCDDFYMIDAGHILLHESADTLLSDYAVLKLTEEQYAALDKKYLLRKRKDPFGYTCLTNQMAYYRENAPGIVLEKAGLDALITLMIKGESL